MHELALNDTATIEKLIEICTKGIIELEARSTVIGLINRAKTAQKMVVPLDILKLDKNKATIPLAELAKLLAKMVVQESEVSQIEETSEPSSRCAGTGEPKALGTCAVRQELPRSIVSSVQISNSIYNNSIVQEFPYSRHSSYEELCDLVKAFEPVDVYPCTIDEDYLNLSVSIASLFGHLCLGTTFAHDEEMALLASHGETLKRGTNDLSSQSMPSAGEASLNRRGTSSVPSVLKPASDPESHALNSVNRVLKRPRASPPFLRNHQGDSKMSLTTEISTPTQKLPRLKQSFRKYVGQSKPENLLATSTSSDPAFNHISSHMGTSQDAVFGRQGPLVAPNLRNNPSANTVRNQHSVNNPAIVHPGTQAKPIELSDGDPPSQGNVAGDFLLDDMPEPDDVPGPHYESQLGSDTQITISDTAFESQSPRSSIPDSKAVRLQQRKEAYKAAKEPSGIWGNVHGLLSSTAHHGDEEVEL